MDQKWILAKDEIDHGFGIRRVREIEKRFGIQFVFDKDAVGEYNGGLIKRGQAEVGEFSRRIYNGIPHYILTWLSIPNVIVFRKYDDGTYYYKEKGV